MTTATAEQGVDTMTDFNLGDIPPIPDLSGFEDSSDVAPWTDGWYAGTIVQRRAFTDKNGNDRVFESGDTVSQKGDSRNIRLQIELKRQGDNKTLNISTLLNYQPETLTQESVQQILAHKAKVDSGEEQWGSMFRGFLTLMRLGKLQKIAGVRSFSRTSEGSLDLTPLWNKPGYFRIAPDPNNDRYKEIKDFSAESPKKSKVL